MREQFQALHISRVGRLAVCRGDGREVQESSGSSNDLGLDLRFYLNSQDSFPGVQSDGQYRKVE